MCAVQNDASKLVGFSSSTGHFLSLRVSSSYFWKCVIQYFISYIQHTATERKRAKENFLLSEFVSFIRMFYVSWLQMYDYSISEYIYASQLTYVVTTAELILRLSSTPLCMYAELCLAYHCLMDVDWIHELSIVIDLV